MCAPLYALCSPYKGYNKAKFFDRVVRREERPAMDRPDCADWPESFKVLCFEGGRLLRRLRNSHACPTPS